MLNTRMWDILHAIAAGKSKDEIDPPLVGTEIRFFDEEKASFDKDKENLPEGVTPMFVPVNDPDFDEMELPWPPVYDD